MRDAPRRWHGAWAVVDGLAFVSPAPASASRGALGPPCGRHRRSSAGFRVRVGAAESKSARADPVVQVGQRAAQASSSTVRLRVRLGSTGTPGPMVAEMLAVLM